MNNTSVVIRPIIKATNNQALRLVSTTGPTMANRLQQGIDNRQIVIRASQKTITYIKEALNRAGLEYTTSLDNHPQLINRPKPTDLEKLENITLGNYEAHKHQVQAMMIGKIYNNKQTTNRQPHH
jgi:hypothetical protein